MKKIVLTLALALSLSGCASFQKGIERIQAGYEVVTTAGVSQRTAVIAMQSYDVVAITATNYQRLRRCTGANGPVCRDPALRTRIDAAIYAGRSARNNIKAYLRQNPSVTVIRLADYGTLTKATDTLLEATAVYRSVLGK